MSAALFNDNPIVPGAGDVTPPGRAGADAGRAGRGFRGSEFKLNVVSKKMSKSLRVKQRPFANGHREPETALHSRVASLWSKGPLGIWQTACSLVEDYWFEKRHGLAMLGDIESENFVIDSQNNALSAGYGPTRKRHFRKLMVHLALPLGSVFVDVGCGAGKILLMATQYPFKRIVGIEFSPWLCNLARANLKVFKQRFAIVPNVEIMTLEITDYEIQPDETVFFMCNPFRGAVMTSFLDNLAASREAHPRPIWLLYNNPVEHDLIMAQGLFSHHEHFHYGGGTIVFYRCE